MNEICEKFCYNFASLIIFFKKMSKPNAWVTLATNDGYAIGALVLAHSLRKVATAHKIHIIYTDGVTPNML